MKLVMEQRDLGIAFAFAWRSDLVAVPVVVKKMNLLRNLVSQLVGRLQRLVAFCYFVQDAQQRE